MGEVAGERDGTILEKLQIVIQDYFIERVVVTKWIARDISRWRKMLLDEGWEITALLSSDEQTIVAFGFLA